MRFKLDVSARAGLLGEQMCSSSQTELGNDGEREGRRRTRNEDLCSIHMPVETNMSDTRAVKGTVDGRTGWWGE